MRHFKNEINREDINERIKLIENSKGYYISENGNIYKTLSNGCLFKKKNYENPTLGYVYSNIIMNDGTTKTFRVHKLVAIYFIPNPDNLPIVGHEDNNKSHNCYKNLYWTTVSENTKKAFDDKLIENAKGYDDSQSKPINVFKHGELLKDFGSVKEAVKELNIPQSTILRRCHNNEQNKIVNYRQYKEFDFKFQ